MLASVDEQAAEDMAAKLEPLGDGHGGAGDRRVPIAPRPELLLRPEEVNRRSEAIDSPAALLRPSADPDHDAGRFGSCAIGSYGKLQGDT